MSDYYNTPQQTPAPQPQKNWFARHKVLTVIGAFVVVAVVGVSLSPSETTSTGSDGAVSTSPANDHKPANKADKPEPEYTASQENAIDSARGYLDFQAFSKQGLVDQLSSKAGDGFPRRDAVFAVNHMGPVDWRKQAVASAESYLDFQSFSCDGLVQQLEFDKFTPEQAQHAGRKVGLC